MRFSSVDEVIKKTLRRALQETAGNRSRAAYSESRVRRSIGSVRLKPHRTEHRKTLSRSQQPSTGPTPIGISAGTAARNQRVGLRLFEPFGSPPPRQKFRPAC